MTPEAAVAWIAAGLVAGAAAIVEAMREKPEPKKERVPVPVEKDKGQREN